MNFRLKTFLQQSFTIFTTFLQCNEKIFLIRAGSKLNRIRETRTLPKLELEAAVLLSEKIAEQRKLLGDMVSEIQCYSDNATVMGWIRALRNCGVEFVRRRIQMILKNTNREDWKQVGTHANPANLATRGLLPAALVNSKKWWQGPSFIQKDEELTPEEGFSLHVLDRNINSFADYIGTYNSMIHLTKVTAWIKRFIQKLSIPIMKGIRNEKSIKN